MGFYCHFGACIPGFYTISHGLIQTTFVFIVLNGHITWDLTCNMGSNHWFSKFLKKQNHFVYKEFLSMILRFYQPYLISDYIVLFFCFFCFVLFFAREYTQHNVQLFGIFWNSFWPLSVHIWVRQVHKCFTFLVYCSVY